MTSSKIGLRPTDALLIVDLQRDFCAGGKLAVAGGDDIVPLVNDLVDEAETAGASIVASRDWHPPDHSSFAARGGPWPEHCVRGTEGAKFHARLRLPAEALLVSKAEYAEREQYSAFDGAGLAEELRRRGVERVFVVGLAEDVCVRATAIDAVRSGFEAHVLRAATRPITPAGGERARAEMREAGVLIEASRERPIFISRRGAKARAPRNTVETPGRSRTRAMPDINTQKVCFVIVKARELESEDEGVQPDSSNPSDDKFVSVLTEEAFSPNRLELVEFIDAMDEDEQAELVALAWVGRGDFSADEWDAAVAQAKDRHKGPTSAYLLGIPLLASYLEAGLDEFDESCEDFEDDRQ